MSGQGFDSPQLHNILDPVESGCLKLGSTGLFIFLIRAVNLGVKKSIKNFLKVLIIMPLIFLISACSSENKSATLSNIDQALSKNRSLDSGCFEKTLKYDNEKVNEFKGVFIKQGNSKEIYDWFVNQYDWQGHKTQESVFRDGKYFVHIHGPENSGNIKWQENREQIPFIKEVIAPLLSDCLRLEEIYIDKAEVNKDQMNHSKILLKMSDSYSENLKEKSISDLKSTIKELEKINDQTGQVEAMKAQIQIINNHQYNDQEIEIIIDQNGYLVSFSQNYLLVSPETDNIEVSSTVKITEYNIDEPYRYFPVMDESIQ